MKNLLFTTMTVMSLVLIGLFTAQGKEGPEAKKDAKSKFGEEMLPILESQKAYTMEVLNLMPEDKFDYRPTEEVRSFAELFKHIAGSFQIQQKFLKGTFTTLEDEFPAIQQMEKSQMSKQQIVDLLSSEFDNMKDLLSGMTEKDLRKTFTFSFFPGAPVKNYREIFTFSRRSLDASQRTGNDLSQAQWDKTCAIQTLVI